MKIFILLFFIYINISYAEDQESLNYKNIVESKFSDVLNMRITWPVFQKPLHTCWKQAHVYNEFFKAQNNTTLEEFYEKEITKISQTEKDDTDAQFISLFNRPLSINLTKKLNAPCNKYYWDNESHWGCKDFTYDTFSNGYIKRWYEINELLDYNIKSVYFTIENNTHNLNFSHLQIHSYETEDMKLMNLMNAGVLANNLLLPIYHPDNTPFSYKTHSFFPMSVTSKNSFQQADFTGDLPKIIYTNMYNKKITTFFIPKDITLNNFKQHIGSATYNYDNFHVLKSSGFVKSMPDTVTAYMLECR